MSQVSEMAITRALALLKSANVQFKIITPEGVEYGELEVVQPKERKRQKGLYEYGELNQYFMPFVEKMKPGEQVNVPFDKYECERLRGALSAWLVKHWGKGNSITAVNRESKVVEVLRVL